jgi:hypothetical protein
VPSYKKHAKLHIRIHCNRTQTLSHKVHKLPMLCLQVQLKRRKNAAPHDGPDVTERLYETTKKFTVQYHWNIYVTQILTHEAQSSRLRAPQLRRTHSLRVRLAQSPPFNTPSPKKKKKKKRLAYARGVERDVVTKTKVRVHDTMCVCPRCV